MSDLIHELSVVRREQVTPKMVRLVLAGARWADVEGTTPDEHVKIVFADPDGTVRLPTPSTDGRSLEWPRPFPPTREYTIRRREGAQVWIDFVMHESGLASDWVQTVEPGETVWVAGPRQGYPVGAEFAHNVLLADHTALPAVARWLEELAPGVTAQVAVSVPDAAEEQALTVRDGVDVRWLHEDSGAASLGDHLAALTIPTDGSVYLWAAGEAGVLKPIRRWARANGFARGTCDIAGYWRRPRTAALR